MKDAAATSIYGARGANNQLECLFRCFGWKESVRYETNERQIVQGFICTSIEQMDKRDHTIAKCIKNMQLSTDEYLRLTELSMKMADELKEIDEKGIGIEPDSLNKVIKAV